MLFGPEGIIGSYRQIHLSQESQKWASAGEHWRVFDTALGRIGLLSGHDALFPESARILALMGCDIIACSAALSAGFTAAHAGSSVTQNFLSQQGPIRCIGTYSEPVREKTIFIWFC